MNFKDYSYLFGTEMSILILIVSRPSRPKKNRRRLPVILNGDKLPKHCKKDINNITPTLPSPLRGGGLGWGGKDTSGEVL